MKSSEFEKLGDWQRKQQCGFNDASNDLVNKSSRNQVIPSFCIYTDRKDLIKKIMVQH